MTIVIQPKNSMVVDVHGTNALWCSYEHWAVLTPGEKSMCIYIGCCKLTDLFRMKDPRTNSYWTKLFKNGGSVEVRVLATSESQSDMVKHSIRTLRGYHPKPVCNIHGISMRSSHRKLLCSNGQTYKNQQDAAIALGIQQTSISRHLQGKVGSVQGYTFAYQGGI